MSKQSGINLIQSALNEVAQPALAQAIMQALSAQHGPSWWHTVAIPILKTRERDEAPTSLEGSDLSTMLYILFPPKSSGAQWQYPVLQRYYNLPNEHRELILGLRHLRNDTAHPSEETHRRFNRDYTQQKLNEIKNALINLQSNIAQSLKPYYDQLQQISVDMAEQAMEWFDLRRIAAEYPDFAEELREYVELWGQDSDAEQVELPAIFDTARVPLLAERVMPLVRRMLSGERAAAVELFQSNILIGVTYDNYTIHKRPSHCPAFIFWMPDEVQRRCVQLASEAGEVNALHFAADFPEPEQPNKLFSKDEKFNFKLRLAEIIASAALYLEIAKSLEKGFPFRNDSLYKKYIELAAEQGNDEAKGELAHCYFNGIGCEKNDKKAEALVNDLQSTIDDVLKENPTGKLSVMLLCTNPFYALADFYWRNAPEHIAYQKKYIELLLSAEKYSLNKNLYMLGYAFEEFSGIRDYKKSAQYYKEHMEQNPSDENVQDAKINFALLMARGRGMPKDIYNAELLIAEAALSGNERARLVMEIGVAKLAQEIENDSVAATKKGIP